MPLQLSQPGPGTGRTSLAWFPSVSHSRLSPAINWQVGALVPTLDAEGLYMKSTMRSGLPGMSGATKGTLAWDPRRIVRAREMLVPQDASH